MSTRALASTAMGFVLAAFTTSARAEPEASTTRLVYSAPEGCPKRAGFVAEITARTSRVRLVDEGETTSELRVDVRLLPGRRSEGTLVVEEAGRATSRSIDGDSCAEVVSALALIAALAIDPEASTAPRAESESPPASPPGPPPPPVLDAPRRGPVASRPARLPPEHKRLARAVGVEAAILVGAAPGALLGGGPVVELGAADSTWLARARVVHQRTGARAVGPGSAAFSMTVARLEGCLGRIAKGAFAARPCVFGEGGLLQATGIPGGKIVAAREDAVPWAAAGATMRLEASLSSTFVLSASGGAGFPFVRRTFVFESPLVVVHEIPPITLDLSAGVLLRW